MKNGEFEAGTVIKGKDLKGYILCKILSDSLVMRGFQYRMGMNEDVNQLAVNESHGTGLHFCLAKDICNYIYYGNKLAIISIPEEEDVYVETDQFRTHRLEIRNLMPLNEEAAWMYLYENGADITAQSNYAVRTAALDGHFEIVKYLNEHGADITARDNWALISAAEKGHLEIVKYLHENGADITAQYNYAIRCAVSDGHLEVVKYLYENGAEISMDDSALHLAALRGYTDVVEYLQANMQ